MYFLPPDEPVELYETGFDDDPLNRKRIGKELELPRVYRRVKHSKDEPYDEETIHPRLSG